MTFLERFVPKKIKIGSTVTVDLPENLVYMELALYTGISLIANAIAKCEIKTYVKNKEVKGEDYFLLNYSPNPNENASKFWHKVVNSLFKNRKALVVDYKGKLFCADSWSLRRESVLYGNVYENVTVDSYTFPQVFRNDEVYLFELDNEDVSDIIGRMYASFGQLLTSALQNYKNSNGQKFKIRIKDVKAGDEEFNQEFAEYITKDLQSFMNSANAVYPEYEGYELTRMEAQRTTTTPSDVLSIKKDMFDTVGSALKIPTSLMMGNTNNTKEVVNTFLTFAVDPVAEMISETLTKRGGLKNFEEGSRYEVWTNTIRHIDIFDVAPNADKLVASGNFSIDEVRKEAKYPEKDEEWSKKHWMTKNYELIEKLLKMIVEGDENNE